MTGEHPGPSWTPPGTPSAGAPAWRCPTCREPLAEDTAGARCTNGHQVDRAREGYLNLLPGGRLRGRSPGDSVEMLRARRALFDAGHYAPVQRAVASMVRGFAPTAVLDAGCGEGAYLAAVAAPHRLGIDVAKDGVQMAARRYPDARWAVASSYRLPLDDGSVDVVMSVFAPRPFGEFHRVLRPHGVAVIASPGPDHLAGLTDLIYGSARVHEQRPHTGAPADGDVESRDIENDEVESDDVDAIPSTSIERERVRFALDLHASTDITNLLHMTPYWWRASEAQRAAIGERARLTTTVDIIVTAHRR